MFFPVTKGDPENDLRARPWHKLPCRTESQGPKNSVARDQHRPVAPFPERYPSLLKENFDLLSVGFTGVPVLITWSPVAQLEMPGVATRTGGIGRG